MGRVALIIFVAFSYISHSYSEVINVAQYTNKIPKGVLLPYNYVLGETDDPLISNTSFRMFCDHRVDYETESIDTDNVKTGDTIFVAYHLLVPFVNNIHPKLKNPYVLVTNESTENHPPRGTALLFYDPKCAAWFSKNMILNGHPKLFQIPVGQTCYGWRHIKPFLPYLVELGKEEHAKSFTALLRIGNAFLTTRKSALATLPTKPFVHFIEHEISPDEYYEHIAASQFVIAPLGGGYDTARFWESLWLKSIPILTHSPLDAMYKDVPCIILDKWSDLNIDVLFKKYEQITKLLKSGTLSYAKADFSYWKNLINGVQNQVRQGSWNDAKLNSTLLSSGDIEKIKSAFVAPNRDLIVFGKGLSFRGIQYLSEFSSYKKITLIDTHMEDDKKYMEMMKRFFPRSPLWKKPMAALNYYVDPQLEHTCTVVFDSKKGQPLHFLFDLCYYQYQFEHLLEKVWKALPKDSVVVLTNAQNPYVLEKTKTFISTFAPGTIYRDSILILVKQ